MGLERYDGAIDKQDGSITDYRIDGPIISAAKYFKYTNY
jgi:hypothetical protein